MSNTTRVRTRPSHEIKLASDRSVPLGVLFGGAQGCKLLQSAIKELPSACKEPGFAAARPWLLWNPYKQVAGEIHLQNVLQGEQLHPRLRSAGCERVVLRLSIKAGVVSISRSANWVSGQPPELAVVTDALDRTANRAINTLGAFAFSTALAKAEIAQKIQQRLAPQQKVFHAVRQQVRPTMNRQVAFQHCAVAPNRRSVSASNL